MFDVQEFIQGKHQQIRVDRLSAHCFLIIGRLLGWIVFPSFCVVSVIKGLILTPEYLTADPMGFLAKLGHIGELCAISIEQHLGPLWSGLYWLSPYPLLTTPNSWNKLVLLSIWVTFLFGIAGTARALVERSGKLIEEAKNTKDTLDQNYPLLMYIQQRSSQTSNRIGDVTGDGNTINQVNTVLNNFREKDPENKLFTWLMAIVLGVLGNLISKLLHIS